MVLVDKDNPTFKKLQQDYEDEFSPITGYTKGADGLYDQEMLMSHWSPKGHHVYLALSDTDEPLGFSVVNLSSMISKADDVKDIAEFYVVPSQRRRNIGKQIAFAIFSLYPGKWEVRQLPDLHVATRFWNRVISDFSETKYSQIEMSNAQWTGFVQMFTSPVALEHLTSSEAGSSLAVFDTTQKKTSADVQHTPL